MLLVCAPWLELDSWRCPWADLELFSSACALDMEPKAACKLELPWAGRSLQPGLLSVEEHRAHARASPCPAGSVLLRLFPFSPLSLMYPEAFWLQTNQGIVPGSVLVSNLKFHGLEFHGQDTCSTYWPSSEDLFSFSSWCGI